MILKRTANVFVNSTRRSSLSVFYLLLEEDTGVSRNVENKIIKLVYLKTQKNSK